MEKNIRFSQWFKGFASVFLIITLSGFANQQLVSAIARQESLYKETFEQYVTTKLVQQAYQVWEDGARLEVNLDTNKEGVGTKSLRVDVIGPNPLTNATSGSIYHSLALTRRDWSNSSGFRFWIKNPSNDSLWLTFNFKEAYNEYWSVTAGAPFIIEGVDSRLVQMESRYGNLVIPPDFSGWVTIPISSFSVPDWNTARGDKQLQLSSIESFALGVTVQNDYPRTFFIDSFEVLSAETTIPVITGVREIEIPTSGEHIEKFQLVDITKGTGITPLWNVKSPANPGLSISPDGSLAIPYSSKAEWITITASVDINGENVTTSEEIQLTGGAFPAGDQSSDSPEEAIVLPTQTAYDAFASDFEKWAMEYRPLFVLISVSLVLIFIFLLSRFQNKLK